MTKKIYLTEDEVRRAHEMLYVAKGLGLREVGESLGCSKSQVKRLFERYECPIRNAKQAGINKRKLDDSAYIAAYENWYVAGNLSLNQTAKKLRVSTGVVWTRFKELGLPCRSQTHAMKSRDLRNFEKYVVAHKCYLKREKLVETIALEHGIHSSTLNRVFKRFGLELRREPGSMLSKTDMEEIAQAYADNGSYRSIAEQMGISAKKVERVVKELGGITRSVSEGIITALEQGRYLGHHARIRTGNSDFFKSWTPASAWVFGLLLSDGSIHKSSSQHFCSLGLKDLDVLQKVVSAIQLDNRSIYGPKIDPSGRRAPYYVLTIANRTILSDLQKLGMHQRKASSIQFPELPEFCIRHFMRGFIDGDGCFGMKEARFSLSSKSKEMMLKFSEYLYKYAEVGIARKRSSELAINEHSDDRYASVYRTETSFGPIYSIQVGGKSQLRNLHEFLYRDVPDELCMERKRRVSEGYF